jgi:adenosylcobinamide-GDP ribazoletransferase
MSLGWRRLLAALHFFVGLAGAGAYWLAAQLWPTSIAVVLAMLATVLGSAALTRLASPGTRGGLGMGMGIGGGINVYTLFFVLIKYNALMALSASRLPIVLPEHLTLGWILVSGHAASRAMVVSVIATNAPTERVSAVDLGVALSLGLLPAALLGIPGLIGLAAAIAARQGLCAFVLPALTAPLPERLDFTQQLTEICFYLGALATWKYV